MHATTKSEWPKPIKDENKIGNWTTSDEIKWYSYDLALAHQENLEHDLWKKLRVQHIKNLCSKYTESHGVDMPNENMKIKVAFATVLTLAALYAKQLYLEHKGPKTVDDDNFLIALDKMTDLGCYLYDASLKDDV